VSISSTFYARLLRQYFCEKKLQSQNVTRETLHEAILYEKFAHKMLLKLTTAFEVSVKALVGSYLRLFLDRAFIKSK